MKRSTTRKNQWQSIFFLSGLIAFGLLAGPTSAKADSLTDWTLQGFSYLSGSFTFDNTTDTLTAWNITAAAGTASNGLNIPSTNSVTAYDYTPANSGTCIGGIPGGSFTSTGGLVLETCPGNRQSNLNILWNTTSPGGLPAAGGTVTILVAEEVFSPTSADISPGCTSGNPTFEPCVAYFRDNSGSIVGTPETSSVPEPSTLALLGLGFAGLGFVRRKIS